MSTETTRYALGHYEALPAEEFRQLLLRLAERAHQPVPDDKRGQKRLPIEERFGLSAVQEIIRQLQWAAVQVRNNGLTRSEELTNWLRKQTGNTVRFEVLQEDERRRLEGDDASVGTEWVKKVEPLYGSADSMNVISDYWKEVERLLGQISRLETLAIKETRSAEQGVAVYPSQTPEQLAEAQEELLHALEVATQGLENGDFSGMDALAAARA